MIVQAVSAVQCTSLRCHHDLRIVGLSIVEEAPGFKRRGIKSIDKNVFRMDAVGTCPLSKVNTCPVEPQRMNGEETPRTVEDVDRH